jgi:hypothetical protein
VCVNGLSTFRRLGILTLNVNPSDAISFQNEGGMGQDGKIRLEDLTILDDQRFVFHGLSLQRLGGQAYYKWLFPRLICSVTDFFVHLKE